MEHKMADDELEQGDIPRSPKSRLLPSTPKPSCWRFCNTRSFLLGSIVVIFILIVALTISFSHSSKKPSSPTSSYAFRVVSYNDVYELAGSQSLSDPFLVRGGAAYVADYVRRVRESHPRSLVLLAGDTLFPSLMSQFFNGTQMIHAHNAIGLDYSCLGNHEFDMGAEVLKERLRESNFKWLNANVYEPDNVTLFAHTVPNAIVDYDFVKVGIFGLLYQASYIHADTAVIRSPLVVAAEQIAELRARGAQFIIALTHQFFQDSCQIANLPGVNLVLTGHDHTMQAAECGVPTLVATSDWRDVWDITVDFGRSGGHVANASDPNQPPVLTLQNVPISSQLLSPDSAVASIIQGYQTQLNEHVKEVVGVTLVSLDVTTTVVRQKESAVANFVLDYIRLQWKPFGKIMDVAVVNGGGFRSNTVYPAGNVTVATVLSIFPFSNVVPVVWLTGKELWLGLEECLTKAEFPQVSGINYVMDVTKPVGARVLNVTWSTGHANRTANTMVTEDDYFLLATNDFVLNLLSSWDTVRTNSSRIALSEDEAPLLSEVMLDAVRHNSPIAPAIDGRISRLT